MRPWSNAWHLLKGRPDFRHFQWGFMLSGFGIMIIQPALPRFFIDHLHLSYTNLSIALSVCQGIAFAASSRLWASWMQKVNIFRFSQWVSIVMGLFPAVIVLGLLGIEWIYISYFIYGVSQSGSNICWNLAGTIFSGDEDSSTYNSVNVMAVGVRGCIAPALGCMLCYLSPIAVLLFGSALLFFGSYFQSRRVHDDTSLSVDGLVPGDPVREQKKYGRTSLADAS